MPLASVQLILGPLKAPVPVTLLVPVPNSLTVSVVLVTLELNVAVAFLKESPVTK